MTKQEIEIAYDKFASPKSVEEDEVEFLIKKECACDQCGCNVLEEYDFPVISIDDDELLCEQCERELKYQTCSVCEEDFEKPVEPNDHRFFISKEASTELNIESGIYQVKKFPFYYGCLIGGFQSFFDDAIELVSTTDVQVIKRFECGKNSQDVTIGEMCPKCFNKYTGIERVKFNYTDKTYSLHMGISVRGMINPSIGDKQ